MWKLYPLFAPVQMRSVNLGVMPFVVLYGRWHLCGFRNG